VVGGEIGHRLPDSRSTSKNLPFLLRVPLLLAFDVLTVGTRYRRVCW